MLNRETTNRIRFVLEDVLPPILRDSRLFRSAAKLAWGEHIGRLASFRERAPFLTAEEYETLYRDHPRVHEGTDNSEACISRIVAETLGESICDVGCGTGVLLKRIRQARGGAGATQASISSLRMPQPWTASTMSPHGSKIFHSRMARSTP